MYCLGLLYNHGHAVAKNLPTALQWYLKGAVVNSDSMYMAANFYQYGTGTAKDSVAALTWFGKAHDAGCPDAGYAIGWMYQHGDGVSVDMAQALAWFQKSAAAGNSDALSHMGHLYNYGIKVEKDYAKANDIYHQAALLGNSYAMASLGDVYMSGWGVDVDYGLALSWYQKGAALGNAGAMWGLGCLYENGLGVDQNYGLAFSYFQKSDAGGYELAHSQLGWMYANGWGVARDYTKALTMIQQKLGKDQGQSETYLGLLYENGWGVEVDYGKAIDYYKKGAAAVNEHAMSLLASMYERGLGTPQDMMEASKWYTKAAELGDARGKEWLQHHDITLLPTQPVTSVEISPNPSAPPTVKLTQEQSRAIVVIKGDAAEGTGFLAQTPEGPVVFTNNHVIAANPNLKILTSGGAPITILSLKGAVDRDLVMFAIKDDHFSYLDLNTDVEHGVSTGDEVITPGNSEGSEVVLNTDGNVLGVGPDKIEVSNPVYHGNSGGPIFHVKSGKVIGVVTMATKVKVTNEVDKASYANANSAITGTMRYFGFRIDTVPKWETYDWNRFLNETAFLKQFHLDSRCLDSLLNGARYEQAHVTGQDANEGPPNSKFYLQNEKLRESIESFHQLSADADNSQRLDAQRELVMDLQGLVDKDMAAIQSPGNFYDFDQVRAKAEIAYRKALKTEIDNIGSKISDLGH
jgi:TPR repeat protein